MAPAPQGPKTDPEQKKKKPKVLAGRQPDTREREQQELARADRPEDAGSGPPALTKDNKKKSKDKPPGQKSDGGILRGEADSRVPGSSSEDAAQTLGETGGLKGGEGEKKTKKRKKDKSTVVTIPGSSEENGAQCAEDSQLKGSEAGGLGAPATPEQESKDKQEKKKKKKKNKNKKDTAGGDPAANPSAVPAAAAPSSPPSAVLPPVSWGAEQGVQAVGQGVGPTWPQPLSSFSQLEGAVDPRLMQAFAGFQRPSPIQSWCWPVLLPALAASQQRGAGGEEGAPPKKAKRGKSEGHSFGAGAARDLVGIAATGSGKTLAFGVPALQHSLEHHSKTQGRSPSVLVLAPTRELAQQIAGVLESAAKPCGLGCVCLYGGAPKGQQKAALSKNPAVVVATPGRLEDLAQEGACSLGNVTFAVLDEADRMLDLGFEPHIRAILGQTNPERRTVMLSATWPNSVATLALDFLKNPVQVIVGGGDQAAAHNGGGPSANKNVKQIVEVVEPRAKDNRLLSLLQQYHKSRKNRVLVFVLYKKEAQRVETFLSSRGWAVGALHGDKSQSDRTRAVGSFKSAEVPLLVATDVAARGLDIPDVECVINYTFPLTTEDYVHRIGRTGRAGKTGTAHTMFTVADKARAGELVNVLREAGQAVPEDLLKFGTAVKKKESKLYGAHFKEITLDSAKPTKVKFADSDDE